MRECYEWVVRVFVCDCEILDVKQTVDLRGSECINLSGDASTQTNSLLYMAAAI